MRSTKSIQDRLEEAIRTLNSEILFQIKEEGNYFSDKVKLYKFIKLIIESNSFLSKNLCAEFSKKRDEFIGACGKLIIENDKSVLSLFENHVASTKIAEIGFREILRSIENSEIKKLTPAEQAWGTINRGLSEYQHLDQKLLGIVEKHDSSKQGIFDPQAIKIGEDIEMDPDQVLGGIIDVVGSTLFLLGYKHGWIDPASGLLTLPTKVEPSSEVLFKSGTYVVLSAQWQHLERAWDRVRFFEGKLTYEDQEITDDEGQAIKLSLIRGGAPSEIELLDKISINRLRRVFYEHQIGYQSDPVAESLIGKPENGIIPLYPQSYVSYSEIVSAGILEDVFCLPVDDEEQLIEGLPLKVWLRGYAYYGVIARDSENKKISKCLRFSKDELILKFISVGLSDEQAKKFIDLTTFQRFAIDLFDAPLLKSDDGFIYFFPVGHYAPALSNILLSRIGSLNRRINRGSNIKPIQFHDKGRRFENRILTMLKNNGINAVSSKYRIDCVDYDCDAIFILDRKLFIFECKNYSLPHGRISSLCYYSHDLRAFGKQVARISLQLNEDKEIVRGWLGQDADWEVVVPCVIQALPWSQGRIDGVYYYDQSALSKFLDGVIDISAIGGFSNKTRRSIQNIPIRDPNRVTAEDLIKEMRLPFQLKLALKGWSVRSIRNPIGKGIFVSIPEWYQEFVSMNEQLEILGVDKSRIAEISDELNFSVNSITKESMDKVFHEGSNAGRVGRNEVCLCGSGKKYKKCCGK